MFGILNALSSDNFKEVGEKKLSFVIGHENAFRTSFLSPHSSNEAL